jgi:hypothetical protein
MDVRSLQVSWPKKLPAPEGRRQFRADCGYQRKLAYTTGVPRINPGAIIAFIKRGLRP